MNPKQVQAIQTSISFNQIIKLVKRILVPNTMIMTKVEIHFAFFRITRCFSQSIIASPKYGKLVSQECTLGELFENKYAARIRNGVVGSIGNSAPMAPKATHIQPNISKIVL